MLKAIVPFLLKPVDNTGIILFRIIFGLLIFLESAGAILTGWVKETFITPEFHFTFIGFEWLQPLPGNGMYFYYGIMSFFGLCVMVGFFYRWSLSFFTLMWTATYLMQKSHYNNHYYLLILLCLLMLTIPAHHYKSFDVKRNPSLFRLDCGQWCYAIIIIQVGIVFTYAAIAKLNSDWLSGIPIKYWLSSKSNYPIIGGLLGQSWMIYVVAYGGIFFDALITPALLWRRTRIYGFIAAIIFHGFNSAVFQIGIFPYLMIGISLLFFDPEKLRKLCLKSKPHLPKHQETIMPTSKTTKLVTLLFVIYFIVQLILPIRHHFYQGDVAWTEEGHRMAWRMMLRIKSGYTHFEFMDPVTGQSVMVYPQSVFSKQQAGKLIGHPDMIWQAVQILKTNHQTDIIDPEIYVISQVSLNGHKVKPLIDPTIDLSKVKWQRFRHSSWLLPNSPEDQ